MVLKYNKIYILFFFKFNPNAILKKLIITGYNNEI